MTETGPYSATLGAIGFPCLICMNSASDQAPGSHMADGGDPAAGTISTRNIDEPRLDSFEHAAVDLLGPELTPAQARS